MINKMALEVKKKEGESASAFLYRFSKKIKRSGIIKESKKRKFKTRNINRNKRRVGAIYREAKKLEVEKSRKLGLK